MKKLPFVLNLILQCTWGFLQTFLGSILLLWAVVVCRQKPFLYKDTIACVLPNKSGSLSLGLFFFLHPKAENNEFTKRHEWGHTRQSLILGPLYLLIVALPSAIWCNCFRRYREEKNIGYYVLYTEKWANICAGLPTVPEKTNKNPRAHAQ